MQIDPPPVQTTPQFSSLTNLAVQLPVGGSSQGEDMEFSQLGRLFHITQVTDVDPGDEVMASTPPLLPPSPLESLWPRSSALVLSNDQGFYPERTQSPEESKLALVVSQRNVNDEQAMSEIREDLASPQTRVTKVGVFPGNATEIEVGEGETPPRIRETHMGAAPRNWGNSRRVPVSHPNSGEQGYVLLWHSSPPVTQ